MLLSGHLSLVARITSIQKLIMVLVVGRTCGSGDQRATVPVLPCVILSGILTALLLVLPCRHACHEKLFRFGWDHLNRANPLARCRFFCLEALNGNVLGHLGTRESCNGSLLRRWDLFLVWEVESIDAGILDSARAIGKDHFAQPDHFLGNDASVG